MWKVPRIQKCKFPLNELVDLVMKYLTLLFIFLSISSFAQEENSLSKYSYYFYYYTPLEKTPVRSATGFFFKTHKHLYFISDYHALTGMDVSTGQLKHIVDTIIIRCTNNKVTSKRDTVKVPMKIKIKPLISAEAPDLGYLEVNSNKTSEVNLINDLIDKRFSKVIPDSAMIFGFPSDSQLEYIQVEVKRKGFTLKTSDSVFAFLTNKSTEDKNIGNLYSLIKSEVKLHFINSMIGEPGLSGAPAIGIYEKYGKRIYYLSGVVDGLIICNQTHIMVSKVVKSVYLFKLLNSLP